MAENEYGPFENERQALATRAAAVIKAAFDARPGPGASEPECLKVMTDACEATGVELGAYDLGLLRWLAKWETGQAVALAGMIRRAYLAGQASQSGPEPGTVTQWGVRWTYGGETTTETWSEEGNARACLEETLASGAADTGTPVTLLRRKIGPWKEVPDA